jgi:hypothetical protein
MLYEVLREAKHQQERTRFAQAAAINGNNHSSAAVKFGYFIFGIAAAAAATAAFIYL